MTRHRKHNMHHKFIALVLGAAITITGFSAAPARADEDVAKILFGLTALAILGAAINDKRKDKEQTATRNSIDLESYRTKNRYDRSRKRNGQQPRWTQPRPLPDRVAKFNLPAQCQRSVSDHGRRSVLGLRCLRNNYRYVDSLPAACRIEVHNGRKMRRGYGTRCLRKRGYRLSLN
jgi:hypothetical protein